MINIGDLPRNATLDRQAMSAIRGAGAPWVFGWIRAFDPGARGPLPVINFYQINNFADQMINQFQNVSVNNAGANSTLNVRVDGDALNKALF